MSSPPARGGSLWALVAGVFVVETGAFAVIPVLPLYLQARGVDLSTIGLIVGATFVVAFAAQFPAGKLADRFGRRRFLIAGALLFAVSNGGFVLPLPVPALLTLRVLEGLGIAAFLPASSALVADLSPPERRGRAYGWVQTARMGGLTVGPAIGGLVALLGRPVVFETTAALELLAALILMLTIPAHLPQVNDPTVGIAESDEAVAAQGRRQRLTFIGVLALGAGFTILFGSYGTIWPLFMRTLGASDALIGISFTLFGLPLVLVTPLAGWAADHLDRRKLALLGYAGAGICAPIYPLLHSVPLVLVVGVVEAVMVALVGPASNALIMEDVPVERRGGIQGARSSVQSGAEAIGALAGGYLFSLGVAVPFFAGAALGFVGLLIATGVFVAAARTRRR